mmetsp:Transcript_4662/g.9556  ORF Transcript_4662/g.9556 Transcript_4662/m.9556 type:complete len:249 (+) Transcript_4662:1113-1859(+)
MRPHPRQSRLAVFVQCQIHLQLPLPRLRVLGEYIQDQGGSIDHFDHVVVVASEKVVLYDFAIEDIFQGFLLTGSQFGIKYHRAASDFFEQFLGFLYFSGADVGFGIDFLETLGDFALERESGGFDEFAHFGHGFFKGEAQRLRFLRCISAVGVDAVVIVKVVAVHRIHDFLALLAEEAEVFDSDENAGFDFLGVVDVLEETVFAFGEDAVFFVVEHVVFISLEGGVWGSNLSPSTAVVFIIVDMFIIG